MTDAAPGRRPTVVFLNSGRAAWGAEQSLFLLAEHLHRLGVRPVLAAYSHELAEQWRERGLGEAHLVPGPEQYHRRRDLVALLRHARALPSCDALVVFSFALLPAVPLLRLTPALRRARIALDLHDNPPGRKGQRLLRLLATAVDVTVAVSRFTGGQVGGDVRVLYRPVPVPADPPVLEQDPAAALTVAVVGRLDRGKQHLVGLQAVARCRQDVRLVLRGSAMFDDAEYAQQVDRAVQEAAGRIVVEGRRPLEELYDGVDALLVTNPAEPMGRTVAEAQVRGVPVVVPDSGGARELVEPGVDGLVFPPGDVDGLAAALDRLAAEPALRRRLGEAGRGRAARRHDPEAYAAAYLDALLPGVA